MDTDLVVAGYLIKDDKVLLIHHNKAEKWLPPGGHINENEVADDALIREFKEETGLDIELMDWNHVTTEGQTMRELAMPFYVNLHNVGDHNHCCFYYRCKPLSEEIVIQKKEISDAKWFSKEDLEKEDVPEDVKAIALEALKTISE